MIDLNELLQFMVEHRGSDLHLKVGSPPHVRVDGRLSVAPFDAVTPADSDQIAFGVMPKDRADDFAETGETDFALSVSGLGRFRVNVFRQRGSVALVFRRVLPGMPSFDSLGLPPVIPRLAEEPNGLVLVTGPTGSGRTTTLASMVDHINSTRSVNIVTIEDPIEVLHPDKMAIVNQRELGTDTRDYASALHRVLRLDPDVIAIDEIGDSATMEAALGAASTGHLVLSTMSTTRASETIERIVEFFPPFQHQQIRMRLASCLRGIVSQGLLERADGRGRVPAVEVLVATSRVFDHIVDPSASASQLSALMTEGDYHGMQTFDQSLHHLYGNGLISLRDALATASDPTELRLSLAATGLVSAGPSAGASPFVHEGQRPIEGLRAVEGDRRAVGKPVVESGERPGETSRLGGGTHEALGSPLHDLDHGGPGGAEVPEVIEEVLIRRHDGPLLARGPRHDHRVRGRSQPDLVDVHCVVAFPAE